MPRPVEEPPPLSTWGPVGSACVTRFLQVVIVAADRGVFVFLCKAPKTTIPPFPQHGEEEEKNYKPHTNHDQDSDSAGLEKENAVQPIPVRQ